MSGLLAGVLGAYLLGLFALSVYAQRRVRNEEDYLVAGRRLPLWLAWGTLLATWFGAATMLGAAEAARNEGLRGTILDPFASGTALIVAGLFFARPLWEMRLLTLSDFYARVYDRRTEVVASVIMVPGYFGWIAAQYIALAGIQEAFFGIDEKWGILLAAGVMLGYTLVGGMWSVTVTDTMQVFVVLVTLVVLAAVTLTELGGSVSGGLVRLVRETPADSLSLLPAASLAASVGWLATWGNGVLGNIPGQDLMQRVFASKDARTAVRACVLAGVVYILFGLMPVGLGLASRILVPGDQQEKILGVLARNYLSPVMATVFVVSLVSIIVSTCTSAVLAPAAVLGHNLLGRLPVFRGRSLLVDRLSVLLVASAGVVTALSDKSIMELLELSVSIGFAALFVPLVMGIYGRPRGPLPALLAIGFGAAMWFAREGFELAVPLPDGLRDVAYADYVAGLATHWPLLPLVHRLAYWFALLPSGISGTAVSFAGYWLGQAWLRRRRGWQPPE